MNKITFDDDQFERKNFAQRLQKVITRFYPFFNEAFVLSLNAKYGSGKTTFLKMWKNELENGGFGEGEYKVIYINAWETDFDDEPIIPIVNALLGEISGAKVKNALEGALGATAIVTGASVCVINQMVQKFSGVDVERTIRRADEDLKQKDLRKIGADLKKEFSFKLKAYKKLRNELESYVKSLECKPLIIFVDELDRARPDYSVKFLEAIKHIFAVPGVCFVLAVDKSQLENSVKQLYGDIDFENYYLRFVTREADLLEAKPRNNLEFITQLSTEYFDRKDAAEIIFPLSKDQKQNVIFILSELSSSLKLTPRQIGAVLRSFSQHLAVGELLGDNKNTRTLARVYCMAMLVTFHIGDNEFYHQLGRDEVSPKTLATHLNNIGVGKVIQEETPQRFNIIENAMSYIASSSRGADREQIFDALLKFYPGAEKTDETKNYILSRADELVGRNGSIFSAPSLFSGVYASMQEWEEFIS